MAITTRLSTFLDVLDGTVLTVHQSGSLEDTTFNQVLLPNDIQLSALASDVPVNFCDVTTAKIVFIRTDIPIDIKINTNTPIRVNKLMVLTSDVTALFLSNPNNVAANVRVVLVGI